MWVPNDVKINVQQLRLIDRFFGTSTHYGSLYAENVYDEISNYKMSTWMYVQSIEGNLLKKTFQY